MKGLVSSEHFKNLSPDRQAAVIAEIDRVMHAVFDLGDEADPALVREFMTMLKPGNPEDLQYVELEEAA